MQVEHLEVLVEEPSMERALQTLLPKMLSGPTFAIYTYQGKNDLIGKLPSRLKGYRTWLNEAWRILIIIDRDNENCLELKKKIEEIVHEAGFGTPALPKKGVVEVFIRIVVEELEAWYFGDWPAVASAYPRIPLHLAAKAQFRNSDEITGGTWERLEKVLKAYGYFKGGLQKLKAAAEISIHMEPERNTSPSFQTLRKTLIELATKIEGH